VGNPGEDTVSSGGVPSDGWPVEIRRSTRRKRTVSAYRDGDRIVVLVPSRLRRAEEQRLVADLVARVTERERLALAGGARASDEALMRRCRELSRRHLSGTAYPASVRWVSGMRTRWASCTPIDATIRVSERLRTVPDWVLDYVLVHELAHLQVAGHGPRFWALVDAYPRTERARGYLDGLSAGLTQQGQSAPQTLDGESDETAQLAARRSPTDRPGHRRSGAGPDDPRHRRAR
jgi:predicted metal-dependent hydrolase